MVDWIADGDSGASVRAKLNDIVLAQSITTGASPTNLAWPAGNWINWIINVTSGGTGGTEILNIANPANLSSNVGRTVNVTLVTKTVGGDIVKVNVNGGSTIQCVNQSGNSFGRFSDGILDSANQNLALAITGSPDSSKFTSLFGNWNNDTTILDEAYPLPAHGTAGDLLINSGPGRGQWVDILTTPFGLLATDVGSLVASFPAASNNRKMAVVFDADTPVVSSPVVGGGSSGCVVISNGTNYIVMFVLP